MVCGAYHAMVKPPHGIGTWNKRFLVIENIAKIWVFAILIAKVWMFAINIANLLAFAIFIAKQLNWCDNFSRLRYSFHFIANRLDFCDICLELRYLYRNFFPCCDIVGVFAMFCDIFCTVSVFDKYRKLKWLLFIAKYRNFR